MPVTPRDPWEAVALTSTSATLVGLVLTEQFVSLPGAVVACAAAWWIGRLSDAGTADRGGAAG